MHFIDVGKADSIYINSGGYNILIDAGLESEEKITTTYLKQCGVKQLDLVIATHQDKDHIGDMADIVTSFDIKRFWMPDIPDKLKPDSDCYRNLLLALDSKNITPVQPQCGTCYTYGEMVLTVIAPVKDNYSDINNYSIVVKIEYDEKSFLFMGDALEKSEKDILKSGADVKADVLKVGHHGNSESTSQEFLDAVNPQYAVICVGENENNLPKKAILKRLQNCGATVYRTDTNGTVIIGCDGENIEVVTER